MPKIHVSEIPKSELCEILYVPLRPLFQHVQQSIPTFLPPCLNPSSATLFTIRFRTTVATPLQKAAPLVRSNRLKPFCNLGLNGVSTRGSNRVALPFQTMLQTKKHRDFTLGVCKLGLEPWFTQGGTVRAKLHRELFFVPQYTFFMSFRQGF